MANQIQGLDKLLKQFDRLTKIEKQKVGMAAAEELFRITDKDAPVDTGELKDSGKVVESEDGGEVSYETPYIVYVEFDTHPFIRPSIDENMSKLSKKAKEELQRLVKEAV